MEKRVSKTDTIEFLQCLKFIFLLNNLLILENEEGNGSDTEKDRDSESNYSDEHHGSTEDLQPKIKPIPDASSFFIFGPKNP